MALISATPTVLITGAAGNLGSMLARYLARRDYRLRLMQHKTRIADDLGQMRNVEIVRADLAQPETLAPALVKTDVVVHFAGVLFAPKPETFLPETNTQWFANLVSASVKARVRRVILISFPHVEGPTSVDDPATGRLDRVPTSVHAQTRLEEERILLAAAKNTRSAGVVLRLGMVYGAGVLMIEAARFLARRRLLAVWREPTFIQIISVLDYLRATEAAIARDSVNGIYHVGDERPLTLQEFLDSVCRFWGYSRPMRLPLWMINAAAMLSETYAGIFRTTSPLTRDFIKIGRVSYWGDTRRMREELLPNLEYPTLESGLTTLAENANPYFTQPRGQRIG